MFFTETVLILHACGIHMTCKNHWRSQGMMRGGRDALREREEAYVFTFQGAVGGLRGHLSKVYEGAEVISGSDRVGRAVLRAGAI